MKIRVKFENQETIVEIPDGDYSVMLDIDYEKRLAEADESKKNEVKRCNTVQEMFDIMNKQEYNNWHKFDRHRGQPKTPYRKDDECEDETDAMDKLPDCSDVDKQNKQADYEDLSLKINKALKPSQAELIIAIHVDGYKVSEFAALVGASPNTISHRLQRAEKNLKKLLDKTSLFE